MTVPGARGPICIARALPTSRPFGYDSQVMMSSEVRRVRDVLILDVRGDLSIGEGADGLAEVVREHLEDGHPLLIVNTDTVHRIDSLGIAAMVECNRLAGAQKGRVCFIAGKELDRLRTLLKPMGLEIYDDEESALASF